MMLLTLVRRSVARHRALIAALTALLCGFQVLLVVVAGNLQRQGLFSQLAALVPPFIQEAMGGLAVASFAGTIALGFFHPVVMLTLTCGGIYLASEPAGEVEHGLVDLVVARPVPRHFVIVRSALMCGAVTGAMVALMFVSNRIAARWLTPEGAGSLSNARLALVACNLLVVAWTFSGAGLAAAASASRRATAAGAIALTAVFLYLLQFAAVAWTALRPAARVSPFHYYEAMPTLLGASEPWRNIAGLIAATLILVFLAEVLYARRDL